MPWYAVNTKPKQEDRVSSQLVDGGLEVFLPKIQVRRRRRGSGTFRIEPLFPGYLFVSAGLTPEIWDTVRWARGVKTILGCDGVPSVVPDEPIAWIKQRVGADGVVHANATFAAGDRVRVKDGPFAGLVGIMAKTTSRAGRVRVLLDILRGATIELEDVDLELAS
jgi:transcriptional antiterminator RfaH